MDLLIRRPPGRLLAATLGLLLTGCGTGSGPAETPRADPDTVEGSRLDAPVSTPPMSALERVRGDETVLGRHTGAGADRSAVTGTTRDLVYVYAVCAGGAELRAELVDREASELVVPCDGVVSRMQVYTEPGRRFRLGVDAADGQRWAVLVTARDQRGRD